MIGWRKRFWSDAAAAETAQGFGVTLDGKPVSTPARAPLAMPTRALAEAVAAEWACVEAEVDPSTMPLTRLANSTIDKIGKERAGVAGMLAEYGGTDLLCYRAAAPAALAARQAAAWDPLLVWAQTRFGARLICVSGIMFSQQEPAGLEALHGQLRGMDDFALMAVHDLVTLSGSLIIGLAVHDGRLAAAEAWALSRIDEGWQEEQWGKDDEATASAEVKRRDFHAAGQFLALSRP